VTPIHPAFPPHLTPFERARLARLVARLAADPRVTRVRLFGSRARARSRADSDLDLAVDLAVARRREIEAWLADTALGSDEDLAAPPVQIVALFAGEPTARVARALSREGIELWTRS
jgi:predicted nucleotidyltransferase